MPNDSGSSSVRTTRRTQLATSWLLTLVAAGAAACGEPSHRLGGKTCGGGAELVMIDDMEDPNKAAIIVSSGRAGTWYAYNDKTVGGVQTPGTLVDVFPMAELDPSRGRSRWAARTRGSGFTTWGAGIACDLNLKYAYDASEYTGISFWVRSLSSVPYDVRVQISDRYTSPRGGECSFAECNDDFGATVIPNGEWQQVNLYWSELSQAGFAPSPLRRIDTSAIYAIKFQTGRYAEFDFFIDDVAFLCTDPARAQ